MVKNKNNGLNLMMVAGLLALVIIFIAVLVLAFLFIPGEPFMPQGIAIIPLKGEISNNVGSFDSTLSSDKIVELIEEAESNPSVGAIFIDIDSPGGGVVASKQIVYKIRASKKPVYSYINSVGASGAYYVAAATDYIMADEDSITGSIGVISIVLNFQELLDNIGVKVTILKEGKFKAIGSPFAEFTEEEQEIFQGILTQVFIGFKEDILEFRSGKLSQSTLESVADGRILSGRQALESNLVDELLPKEQALNRAAELAGIKNPNYIYYEKTNLTFFDVLFESGRALGSGFVSSIRTSDSIELK